VVLQVLKRKWDVVLCRTVGQYLPIFGISQSAIWLGGVSGSCSFDVAARGDDGFVASSCSVVSDVLSCVSGGELACSFVGSNRACSSFL